MPIFRVWDELNAEEEDATTIDAVCEDDAAVAYAEADTDGWTDGLYHNAAQPISVRTPLGKLFRFNVWADMEPTWRCCTADNP